MSYKNKSEEQQQRKATLLVQYADVTNEEECPSPATRARAVAHSDL